MRVEGGATTISWIPSEAMPGLLKLPFEMGVSHYDDPPPERLEDLQALRQADRFRFANQVHAWIEVDGGGRITGHGQDGGGHIGVTTLRLGKAAMAIQAVALPDLRPQPEVHTDHVRFVQSAGGRTGAPMPRRVRRKPFVQLISPWAFTTIAVTLHADGHVERELIDASRFPRHWLYDERGALMGKTGVIDFKTWAAESFGDHTPWGDVRSPALVTAVETALERELSVTIMRGGAKPAIRALAEGETLVEQGQEGRELFLLLDGVLSVEVDSDPLVELGPGAVVGERALLEGGRRTATLRAVTPCKVAVADHTQVDREALEELASGHRREERGRDPGAPAMDQV